MILDELKNLKPDESFNFAIAVGQEGQFFHCAILYRWHDEIRTIDFYDQRVREIAPSNFINKDYLYVKIDKGLILDSIAEQVPPFCELIKVKNNKITFGIKYTETKFNKDGELIYAKGDLGLTCATFILAILEGAMGFPLIDQSTWQEREEDKDWQKHVLDYFKLKNYEEEGYYSQQLIDFFESNLGCFRFRPEEVGAASGNDTAPSDYSFCKEYGNRLRFAIDHGVESYNKVYNS
jgi:hypothetical protein